MAATRQAKPKRERYEDRIAALSVDMKMTTREVVREIEAATGKRVGAQWLDNDLLGGLNDQDLKNVWRRFEVISLQSRSAVRGSRAAAFAAQKPPIHMATPGLLAVGERVALCCGERKPKMTTSVYQVTCQPCKRILRLLNVIAPDGSVSDAAQRAYDRLAAKGDRTAHRHRSGR